jgi:uncharacterized coiled-coil protein SlyX
MAMGQLKHEQSAVGEPCRRCGVPCSRETANVPCFEEGDTWETWKARQPSELFKDLFKPPVEMAPKADINVASKADIDRTKAGVSRALLHHSIVNLDRRQAAADVVVSELSALIVAHLQDVKLEMEKLAAQVREFEAQLAGRPPT